MTDVLCETRDTVARITLNRPDSGNVFGPALLGELYDHLLACEADPAVRVVQLDSAGPVFSLGGDLKHFTSPAGSRDRAETLRMVALFHNAVSLMVRMPKPVVTVVDGMAAGGGLSLAIAGDIVLAGSAARFTVAYTRVGLSPDGGSTFLLPRLIGWRRAKALMLTNRILEAGEALAIGLVDAVIEDAALADEARSQATALAQGPRGAFAAVKRLMASSLSEGLEGQLALEADALAGQIHGNEGQEGMTAFLGKRAPDFPDA